MKKKIAVIANGWSSGCLKQYIDGLKKGLDDGVADICVFVGYDAFGRDESDNRAEACIYELPRFEQFDGAVFVGPGMDDAGLNEKIISGWQGSGTPMVSIGQKIDGAICIYTDNYEGMKPLADHLLEEHAVKKILFVAGPKDSQDSNDRLRAVKDSCREHGVSFGEEDILYSNWDVYYATDHIRRNFGQGQPLPDVIMCANDNTALFISFVLEESGILSPRDVLLTGFDGTDKARSFYPSLTSVAQPFEGMGEKTAECFRKIFAGEDPGNDHYIPCEFVIGESCGCNIGDRSDVVRRRLCRQTPRESVLADFRRGRIHYMENAVLKSDSYQSLGTCLQEFFYDHDGQEGNPFYIFISPEFAKLAECELSDLPAYTLPDKVDMIVGKNGDVHYPVKTVEAEAGLLPGSDDKDPGHIFVFMPLYLGAYVCGCMVMSDNTSYFSDSVFLSFKTAFNRILETYSKNLKLASLNDRLYELLNRDPMTMTRNRVSYENFRKDLREKAENGEMPPTAFVMFDINDLKYVNDTFGHEKGDEYIRNSCRLICDTFAHSIVFRIGGDEFVSVLQGRDFDDREKLIADFREKLRIIKTSGAPPEEKVSVAFGMAVYDPSADDSIDAVIKRADEEMYINKRQSKQ
ncbi:MAG: GGDEF domain-containing protein [Lachnospiraceae bacterium]|nr:GGDEF domain-containing protein [Lachnospiraceae bacterium]